MTEKKKYTSHIPPRELLHRYSLGERNFANADISGGYVVGAWLDRADLSGADLSGTNLWGARLRDARLMSTKLCGANLTCADLGFAKLQGADLRGAHLSEADLFEADLSGADLGRTNLGTTNLHRAKLDGSTFGGAELFLTHLLEVDLSSLCDACPPVQHLAPSQVDFKSILLSLRSPSLKGFLQRAGLPEVFVEYMVDCARALDGSLLKKLLQSTFISYGGPDEPLARRLYEALHQNGVTTFFFPEHVKPGQRIGRVVRENVESYDRILLLCSKASLVRPGVLYEIEAALERERRDGGAEYLIPIELDDCLRVDGAVLRKDLVRVLRDRVCADFRGAQEDEGVFQASLRKLIAALRPPDLALWRPPGATKPTEL